MILTTTDHIEGKTITEYLGLVSAVYTLGLLGTRKGQSNRMKEVNQEVSMLLRGEAYDLGADAVVGIKYAAVGDSGHVLMGTAVKLT